MPDHSASISIAAKDIRRKINDISDSKIPWTL